MKHSAVKRLEEKTGFDQDEINHWYAGFMRDSPTGEMQRSEFIKIYRELFPNGNATTFSDYIFNTIDKESFEVEFLNLVSF